MPCCLKCHFSSDIWSSRFLGATDPTAGRQYICSGSFAPPPQLPALALPWHDNSQSPTTLLYTMVRNWERQFLSLMVRQTQPLLNPEHEQLVSQGQRDPQWMNQDRGRYKLSEQERSCGKMVKRTFLDCISQNPLWMKLLITDASVQQKIKSYFIYIYLF